MTDLDYSTINNPYDSNLNRNAPLGSGNLTSNYSGDVSSDELAGGGVIKSGGALSDITISNFIKSRSYQPKKQGFYIDARKGYIECMDLYAAGDITAIGGTIGGWVIGETTLTGGSVTLDSAGIITGGIVQTSTSGLRLALDGSVNQFQWLKDNDKLAYTESYSVPGTTGLFIHSTLGLTHLTLQELNTNQGYFNLQAQKGVSITSIESMLNLDDGITMGIRINGFLRMEGSIIPQTNNFYDIGTLLANIKNIYCSGNIGAPGGFPNNIYTTNLYSYGTIYSRIINPSSTPGGGFSNDLFPTTIGLNFGGSANAWEKLYINSIIFVGSTDYINFNNTSGVSGYGIRDNGGTMQYKNVAGAWTDIGSGGGGAQTPWLSNINGGGYTLSNIGDLSFSASDHYIKRGTDNHLKFTAANIESSRHFVSDISGAHTLGSTGQYWGRLYTIGVTAMTAADISDFSIGKLRIPVGTNRY